MYCLMPHLGVLPDSEEQKPPPSCLQGGQAACLQDALVVPLLLPLPLPLLLPPPLQLRLPDLQAALLSYLRQLQIQHAWSAAAVAVVAADAQKA
jgi:hypothetical protein